MFKYSCGWGGLMNLKEEIRQERKWVKKYTHNIISSDRTGKNNGRPEEEGSLLPRLLGILSFLTPSIKAADGTFSDIGCLTTFSLPNYFKYFFITI